jgi:hypothetical protein
MSIYPTPLKSQFADQIALVCISDAMTYRKLKWVWEPLPALYLGKLVDFHVLELTDKSPSYMYKWQLILPPSNYIVGIIQCIY